jgi:hypothetical protein
MLGITCRVLALHAMHKGVIHAGIELRLAMWDNRTIIVNLFVVSDNPDEAAPFEQTSSIDANTLPSHIIYSLNLISLVLPDFKAFAAVEGLEKRISCVPSPTGRRTG